MAADPRLTQRPSMRTQNPAANGPAPASQPKPDTPPTALPASARVDACITSPLARAALVWGPFAVWLLAVSLGVCTHVDLLRRPNHPLKWFDQLVFRRYGAALPFLFLLPRLAVGRLTARPATWGRPCLLLYSVFTLLRLSLYALHLVASTGLPQVLSDHIYLAASVVACLQLELVCTVNDAVKAVHEAPQDSLGALAGSTGMVLEALTILMVSGDMFFTAKYYHHRVESIRAIVLGLVTFQGPILWLLWWRPATAQAQAHARKAPAA